MSGKIKKTPKVAAARTEGYIHVTQHIEDELRRLDALIELSGKSLSANGSTGNNGSNAGTIPEPRATVRVAALADGSDPIQEQEEKIAERIAASELNHFPLLRLRSVFGLSQLEYDLLIICIAPALGPRYAALFAELQRDPERACATPGLAALLLEVRGEGVARIRESCSAHAPLMRHGLLKFRPAPGDFTLLSTPCVADERIVDYVLGGNYLDSAGAGLLFSVFPDEQSRIIAEDVVGAERLERIAGGLAEQNREPALVYLHGGRGAPFADAAGAICSRREIPLLRLEFDRLLAESPAPRDLIRRALRESLLFQGALLVEGFDADPCEDCNRLREFFLNEAARLPGLYFVAGANPELVGVKANLFRFFRLALPVPEFVARERIWRDVLVASGLRPVGIDERELAASFRFNAEQISRAVARARDALLFLGEEDVADPDGPVDLPVAALLEGCRAESNRKLNDLAVRVPTKFGWDDIVLPKDSLKQLLEIEAHVRHAETVYEAWGFENQILAGRGLNVLFSGPSGTGKTMAASILAGELKLELFKIDLSTVVSKYIGETEKNLSRIFAEAETSNAVLFFDEADALFGKRSEVKDAHDRNANIEVGYLLQKMEEYRGVSILATNLRENIDEAFLRRLHSIVEFPFPAPAERERIWRIAFPAGAPRANDIDYKFLSERIKLAGGGIKNVVLNAAFLAAEGGGAIDMRHMVNAARREYQKDGRNLLQSDLGPYAALVETEQD